MLRTFFTDLSFSEKRATSYWIALQQQSLQKLTQFGFNTDLSACSIFKKSSLFSIIIYGTDEQLLKIKKSNDNAFSLLDIESRCFDKILVQPELWESTFCIPTHPTYQYDPVTDRNFCKSLLLNAESLIKSTWLECFQEYESLIRGVSWLRSNTIENFSDPKLFGIIHLKIHEKITPFSLALDLIHESAHHALFVENTIDPTLITSDTLLYSPLRNEYRPAIGVFHAAIATGRMLKFTCLVLSSDQLTLHSDALAMFHDLVSDQSKLIHELQKVNFTVAGKKCFIEIQESLAELQRKITA